MTYLGHLRVQYRCNRVDDGVDAGLANSGADVEGAHRGRLAEFSVLRLRVGVLTVRGTHSSYALPVHAQDVPVSHCFLLALVSVTVIRMHWWFRVILSMSECRDGC